MDKSFNTELKNLMEKAILIAQITDTHIMAKGDHWMNMPKTETAQRLKKVIEIINNLTTKPDFVIHTGDIVDKGDIDSYMHAKELLDKLKIKYFLTCGNHDNFHNLKHVFNDHNYFIDQNFAHYVIEDLPLRIIVMDTQVAGHEFGKLCEARKKWLVRTLLHK